MSVAGVQRVYRRRDRPLEAARRHGALGLLSLAAVVMGACTVPPSIPGDQAAEAISLSLEGGEPLEGGEAALWPSGEPVRFRATAANAIAARFDADVEDETWQWSATAGSFSAVFGPETEWRPPPLSTTAAVTVTYTCRVRQRPGLFARYKPFSVQATAARIIVTATPGRLLRDGVLDGYRLGVYPDPEAPEFRASAALVRRQPESYRPPDAFYKVTEDNFSIRLSKHFRLGDYALHYPWFSLGLPQYIALDPALVLKIEDLIALMQQNGFPQADHIAVIYPFRPPAYNLGMIEQDRDESLKAVFSMHQYGKAIDLIIDADADLVMDDLNADGVSDVHDALLIARFVNILDRRYLAAGDRRLGGAGVYPAHDFHERRPSPYIHIDVRNYTGEAGRLIRWPSRLPDGSPLEWEHF
ncbi:MAG: hypothetical protein Kow0059_06150 [Candidatus Sumerlaeia bacterium]